MKKIRKVKKGKHLTKYYFNRKDQDIQIECQQSY
jgi:hypothetical protein